MCPLTCYDGRTSDNSRLPGLDGFQFIAQVLAHLRPRPGAARHRAAESFEDPRLERLERVSTLAKPFSLRDLTSAVERCLHPGLRPEPSEPATQHP